MLKISAELFWIPECTWQILNIISGISQFKTFLKSVSITELSYSVDCRVSGQSQDYLSFGTLNLCTQNNRRQYIVTKYCISNDVPSFKFRSWYIFIHRDFHFKKSSRNADLRWKLRFVVSSQTWLLESPPEEQIVQVLDVLASPQYASLLENFQRWG